MEQNTSHKVEESTNRYKQIVKCNKFYICIVQIKAHMKDHYMYKQNVKFLGL